MSKEWRDFDLSALTYPQFLAFVFDRPVVGDPAKADNQIHSGLDIFTSDPAIVVSHFSNMCKEFAQLRNIYSLAQMDQGLWALLGTIIRRGEFFDPAVTNKLRIECIQAMDLPFAEVAARFRSNMRETFYWMWWDMIRHHFWQFADRYKFDYPALNDDHKQMLGSLLLITRDVRYARCIDLATFSIRWFQRP